MFKESFKYYKSRNPPPDLDAVLDFSNLNQIQSKVKSTPLLNLSATQNLGLTQKVQWEAFELIEHPGLIFIKNPFTTCGEEYWAWRCLKDYTKKPNVTNLLPDALPNDKNLWEMCENNKLLLHKLRWTTLGYHHDWDTKIYREVNKGQFPKDLSDLTKHVGEALGFHIIPQAAIVNFYHLNSTLAGHTDHSEPNLAAPLISFSFGQTAIFLIGGTTREDNTTAMFLRSGDIIIMSGQARLCYHGVPKILQTTKTFGCDYLNHSRININVRQVLNHGEERLKDSI